MSQVNVQSRLNLLGGMSFGADLADYPADPQNGQCALVNGVLNIYSEVDGVSAWMPLTEKRDSFVHEQTEETTQWTVTHNMGSRDFVYYVYDATHSLVLTNHTVVSDNVVTINLNDASTGTAVFFFDSDTFVPEASDVTVDAGSNLKWDAAVVSNLGTAVEGSTIAVSVKALNPYGTPVTYTVESGALPDWASISGTQVVGTAPEGLTGASYSFRLKADDGASSPIYKDFALEYSADNDAPSWITNPELGEISGWYQLQAQASDPENQSLTYSLVSGSFPQGLGMDSEGLISGTVVDDGQSYTATVAVSDGTHSVNRTFNAKAADPALGYSSELPAPSAAYLVDTQGETSNGYYWIDWNGTSVYTYCDLVAGGWMLIKRREEADIFSSVMGTLTGGISGSTTNTPPSSYTYTGGVAWGNGYVLPEDGTENSDTTTSLGFSYTNYKDPMYVGFLLNHAGLTGFKWVGKSAKNRYGLSTYVNGNNVTSSTSLAGEGGGVAVGVWTYTDGEAITSAYAGATRGDNHTAVGLYQAWVK